MVGERFNSKEHDYFPSRSLITETICTEASSPNNYMEVRPIPRSAPPRTELPHPTQGDFSSEQRIGKETLRSILREILKDI